MKALQYIFTSWRNGDLDDKGYRIYSMSEGISNEECTEIKKLMRYVSPKDLKINPSPEEIASYPYNFTAFTLSSGRLCVGQTTYLGKDYSGRFGNYIIHALVTDKDEMDHCPVSLYAQDCIKLCLTQEEQDATPPIPPLEPLDLDTLTAVVDLDTVLQFAVNRESELAYMTACVLAAKEKGIPFYVNDTVDNLVLWCAAIQLGLPHRNALNFSFATYVGDSDDIRSSGIRIDLAGVRSSAGFFNYGVEKSSNRHIVMDLDSGAMTENVPVTRYAKALAKAYAYDYGIIEEFNLFLESTGYTGFDEEINSAYDFYLLSSETNSSEAQDISAEDLIKAVKFGIKYCVAEQNTGVAAQLLLNRRAYLHGMNSESVLFLVNYFFEYADYLAISVYEWISDVIYEGIYNKEYDRTKALYTKLSEQLFWNMYLIYAVSDDAMYDIEDKISSINDEDGYMSYIEFFTRYYRLSERSDESIKAMKLVRMLLTRIVRRGNDEKTVCRLLECFKSQETLYMEVLTKFVTTECTSDTFAAVVSQLDSMGELRDKILDRLLFDPKTEAVALRLYVSMLDGGAAATEVLTELAEKLGAKPDTDVSVVIEAYLAKINEKKLTDAYSNLILAFGFGRIKNLMLQHRIICEFEESDIKTLYAVPPKVLVNIVREMNGYSDILNAVLWARDYLDRDVGIELEPRFDVSAFSGKQYSDYLKMLLNEFYLDVRNEQEYRNVFELFACVKYMDIYSEVSTDLLKRIRRKDDKLWTGLLSYMAIMVINGQDDAAIRAFEGYLVKYLAKLDKEDIEYIELLTMELNPSEYAPMFFGKVRHRESSKPSLKERLFGSFRKNKS